MQLASTLSLIILILEIIAFLSIDFLFSREKTAAKLTDTRLSQKTMKILNVFQFVFVILGILFIIDTWGVITNLNQRKNEVDTTKEEGILKRNQLSIKVFRAQRDWYVGIMIMVINIVLYAYIYLQKQITKRGENLILRKKSRQISQSKFGYRGKIN